MADNLEVRYTMNLMPHFPRVLLSTQRFNLERGRPDCKSSQVAHQLFTMDFGPCFDEPFLCSWECTANAFDRITSKHRHNLLIRSMKMRAVVRCADLSEHSDDDSEEPGKFMH